MTLTSALPVNKASSTGLTKDVRLTAPTLGILPMGAASATGALKATLTDPEGIAMSGSASDPSSPISVTPVTQQIAPAHWGTEKPGNSSVPPIPCTTTFEVASRYIAPDRTAPADQSVLLDDPIPISTISDRPALRLAVWIDEPEGKLMEITVELEEAPADVEVAAPAQQSISVTSAPNHMTPGKESNCTFSISAQPRAYF